MASSREFGGYASFLVAQPYIAVLLSAVLFGCFVVQTLLPKRTIYDQFDRVGNPGWLPKFLGKDATAMLYEGYERITIPFDKPFVIKWWARDNVILPPKYLPDMRRVKAENASFLKNFSDAVSLHHTVGDLYASDRMGDIVRKGLNPCLSSLIPMINDEMKRVVSHEIGECKEWRSFKAVELFIAISHRVVSRLIAGEELTRNEAFISTSITFSDSVMITGMIIAQLPLGPFRRPLGWAISQVHGLFLARVMRITEPVVARRLAEARAGSDKRYNDSIEWAIQLDDPPERDARTMSLEMLHLLEAAAGAPGAMMTEVMYQLLEEPQYQPLLHKEIAAVTTALPLAEAVQNMPLMDSFIMEVNRLYPVGGTAAARTVMREPLILHDGLTLPIGTRLAYLCRAAHHDPRNFPDPLRFDGHRFIELNRREEKSADGQAKYAASNSSTTSLSWGFGKHVCPGRFYAVRLAKLLFIHLLTEYDVEWEDRVEGHPPSFQIEGQNLPNLSQKIRFRAKTKQ